MSSLKESLRQLKEMVKSTEGDSVGAEGRDSVLSVCTRHSEEALESTRKLLEKDPNNRELLDWYAFMLYSNELFREAAEIYKRLLAKVPDQVEHLYYIGCCYYRMAQVELAVDQWQEAVKVDPMSSYGQKAREKIDLVYERDYGANLPFSP